MKKFYAGIKAIIQDKNRGVLLLRDPRIVDVPGGRIDDNENIKEALLREISEELPGTEVRSIGDLLGAYRVLKDIADDTSLVLLFYKVDAIIPDPIVLSEEHTGVIWVKDKKDIPAEGLNDEIKRILNNLFEGN